MALNIQGICESFAGMNVSIDRLKILDLYQVKEGFTAYDTPLLCPRPNDFVSSPLVTPVSFGSGEGRQLDVRYTLTYRYFHAPAGTGDQSKTWADMVVNVFKIFDAVLENDALAGLIDLSLSSISEFGAVSDGSNNMYHGCDITFLILEHVN
jgi:hypothetical protein